VRRVDDLGQQLRTARAELESLLVAEYTDVQLGAIARDVAAAWERTLKAAEPMWSNKHLAPLIAELVGLQVPPTVTDALDRMRLAANADKHDSTPRHDSEQLMADIETLVRGISDVAGVVPDLAVDTGSAPRRRVFIAIYDYETHGESELHIFPSNATVPRFYNREMDTVQIDMLAIDQIAADAATFGLWEWDPPAYATLTEQYRRESSQIYKSASFVGDYRELIRLLARSQHAHADGLLPGLHRADQWVSARTAAAMATVDSSGGATPPTWQSLALRLEAEFGLPRDRRWTTPAAEAFTALAQAAAAAGVYRLYGPLWRHPHVTEWARPPVAGDETFAAAITADGCLWIAELPGRLPESDEARSR